MFDSLLNKKTEKTTEVVSTPALNLSKDIVSGNGYEKKEVLLKASNISFEIEGKLILKDVNIEVKNITRPGVLQGQVVGFLGPSGVGKTIFFEILSGVRKPTTGEVLIGSDLRPVKVGDLGVVQQKYPLFNHRTVYGNLDVAASKTISDKKQRREKIMEYLTMFRLDKHVDHYPAELSGGQRQRVAIAQQLLCSENFLLLDEPFSGLDPLMTETVCELIQQITSINELMTVIVVSHDIKSTASISDTLWLMGRDFDENNNPIPGARIKETYDLIERGLAWQKDIWQMPELDVLDRELREKFHHL